MRGLQTKGCLPRTWKSTELSAPSELPAEAGSPHPTVVGAATEKICVALKHSVGGTGLQSLALTDTTEDSKTLRGDAEAKGGCSQEPFDPKVGHRIQILEPIWGC